MSSFCGGCKLNFTEDDNVVNCSGACSVNLHVECVESEGVKTSSNLTLGKCFKCNTDSSIELSNDKPAESTMLTKQLLDFPLNSFKEEVLSELNRSSEKIEELSELVRIQYDSVNKSNSSTEKLTREFGELTKTKKNSSEENDNLNRSVKELTCQVLALEQHSRTGSEIHRLAPTSCEDIPSLVKDETAVNNEEVKDCEESAADKVLIAKKNKPSQEIVQFQSRLTMDASSEHSNSGPEGQRYE